MQLAASYGTGEPVRVRAIAQTHGIPNHFLVQILLQLKGAGLVASTRGAAGGYQLVKDPAKITLADVMRVIEGGGAAIECNCNHETVQVRALLNVWNDVARVQREMLEGTTFLDLLEQTSGRSNPMYYI